MIKKIISKNDLVYYFYYYDILLLFVLVEIFEMEVCSLYKYVYKVICDC